MAAQGESLIKKTQKGISILAFETSKQSRIMKKRMRIAALQKETKADLRDLGNLVYTAVSNEQSGILEEEEVKILVESIQGNKAEVERLRDAIARLGRAKKHFAEEDVGEDLGLAPLREDEPTLEERPTKADSAPPAAAEPPAEAQPEEAAEEPASADEPAPVDEPPKTNDEESKKAGAEEPPAGGSADAAATESDPGPPAEEAPETKKSKGKATE
jgi:hypothetical protein